MSNQDNIRERILKKTTVKDISPTELQTFLEHTGFILKRKNGSHFIYEYTTPLKTHQFPIPMHNPIKPAYIDMIREIIQEMEETNKNE